MVPTFLFAFCVCAISVLLTAWHRREMRLLRSGKRKPLSRWGALLMLLGIAFWVARGIPGAPPYHLTRFIHEGLRMPPSQTFFEAEK